MTGMSLSREPQAEPLPDRPLRALMLGLVLVFLPYFLDLPFWVVGLALGMVGWRWMALIRQWPLLRNTWLLLILLFAGIGIWMEYGTLVGRDGGVAVLMVLLTLKLNESRKSRDALLLILMAFFALFALYFFRQDVLTLIYTLAVAVFLLATTLFWQVREGTVLDQWRPAMWRFLQALPLALVLFVVFPRPDGPLWSMPNQKAATTGLADQVSPGTVSELAKDDSVALRAEFLDPLPRKDQLYWRGPVYEYYDGQDWTQRPVWRRIANNLQIEYRGRLVRYRSTVEPHGYPWVLALDTFAGGNSQVRYTSNYQAVTLPIAVRQRFELQAVLDSTTGRNEDPEVLKLQLQLPENINPRTRALAESWKGLPPEQKVQAALDFLRAGGFVYTLSPPLLRGPNAIDELLFRTKQGFCEHYAAAFGFLMRAAGMPTRLVGGYLGGTPNADGRYLIVRQSDAHVWNEVWFENQGWVRVDPTGAVSPARINTGLAASLQDLAALSPLLRDQNSWWSQFRLKLDAWQFTWDQWVIGYNGEQQRRLFALLGMSGVVLVAAVMVLLGLALLPAVWRRRLPRAPETDEVLKGMALFAQRLGNAPEPSEPMGEYALRMASLHPEQASDILAIAESYQNLRYGPPSSKEHVQAFLRQVRAFRLKRSK